MADSGVKVVSPVSNGGDEMLQAITAELRLVPAYPCWIEPSVRGYESQRFWSLCALVVVFGSRTK